MRRTKDSKSRPSLFRRLKRWWCTHIHQHKTEKMYKNIYRRRCLECDEIFLYKVVEPRSS